MRYAVIFCLMILSFAAPGRAATAPQVQARVDRTTATTGESLQLFVIVTNGGDASVDTDAITDFKVFPRGTSTSIRIVNLERTRQETLSYMLVPLKKGKLSIPSLSVQVDGKPFRTEPIVVTVTEASAGGPQTADRDVWVEAEVSDKQPYIGQQIAYTFRLYNAVQVRDARFSPPAFDGFATTQLEKRNSYRKPINGRQYAVIEVMYILVPRRTGSLAIEPGVLELGIVRRQARRNVSPFEDFFNHGTLDTRIFRSNALQVQVRPLPPYDSQTPFSGLVGTFDMDASVENTRFKVGDSTTLTIILKGRGNIQDAPTPAVNAPDAFKTYPDNPEENVTMDREGHNGRKIFRTALVPVAPGTYTLPPVSLTYFDTKADAYKTLASQPITLEVAGQAQNAQEPLVTDKLPPIKKKVAFTGRDILPPKQDLNAVRAAVPLSWPFFVLLLLAPLAPLAVVLAVQRVRRKDPGPAAVMKARAVAALKAARQAAGDRDGLLTHLYQGLAAAIFAVAERTGEAMTWKEAETMLLERGLDAETARQAAELLARIESLKFSGAALDNDLQKELLDQTRKMVRKLVP